MEKIIEAIKIFCGYGSSSEQVKEADELLKKLERSKESWSLVVSILELPQQSNDAYFISAKILKTKLEYDFGELTSDQAQQLPAKMLQLLQLHKDKGRSVQGQLVDALVFLYLHMYDKWPDLLDFIKNNFYSDPKMQNYVFLIYEYLPDNVYSKTIVMDDTHRENMILFFKTSLQRRILEELDSISRSQQIDEKAKYKLLKIMHNWVDFKTNEEILKILANHAVFELALSSMNVTELQDASANVLIATLRQLKEEQMRQKYPELFQKIAINVFGYFENCKQAHQDEDLEAVHSYSKVFVKFGTRALKSFMQVDTLDQPSQQFLANMLEVTNYDEIENEQDMCDFWRHFLYEMNVQEDTVRLQLIQRYAQLVNQLLTVSLKKIVFSEELFTLFNEKTPHEIEKYYADYEEKSQQRFYMKDLIGSIADLIGAEEVIVFLANRIITGGLLTDQEDLTIDKARELESVLFGVNQVVQSVQRQVEDGENGDGNGTESSVNEENSEKQPGQNSLATLTQKSKEYLFQILSLALSKQYPWIRLNRTLLSIMISASEFLQQNMQVCSLCFDLMVRYLRNNLLGDVAQNAFEVLCKDCPLFVQSHFATFMQNVYTDMMFNDSVILGISHAVCATDECIAQNLISLCTPYATDLVNYINLPAEQQSNSNVIQNLKKPLKAIKNIIRCVPEREQQNAFPHDILKDIFKQIWPVLKLIMETRSKETGLIENIVSVLKQFILKMSCDFDVFFTDFLTQIVQLYKVTSQSGILYIIEKCVKIFAGSSSNNTFSPILQSAFEILVETTLQLLPTYDDFIDNPDIVEDFFGFLNRFVKYYPVIFFSSTHLLQIVQCVSTGIKLQHKEAAKSLFALMELLYQSLSTEHMVKVESIRVQVEQFREILLNPVSLQFNGLLFQVLSEVPSRDIREYIFDIFLAQIGTFRNLSVPFFLPLISQLKEDILTNKEKEKLIQLIEQSQFGYNLKLEDELVQLFVLLGDRFKKSYRRDN